MNANNTTEDTDIHHPVTHTPHNEHMLALLGLQQLLRHTILSSVLSSYTDL